MSEKCNNLDGENMNMHIELADSNHQKVDQNGESNALTDEINPTKLDPDHKRKSREYRDTISKVRRRMSGTHRWSFPHGGSIRDPLNLKNVRPDDQSDQDIVNSSKIVPSDILNQKESTIQVQRAKSKTVKRNRCDDEGHKSDEIPALKKLYLQPKNKPTDKEIEGKTLSVEGSLDQQRPTCSRTFDTSRKSYETESMEKPQRQMSDRYRYGNYNNYRLKKQFRNSSQFSDSFLQNDPRVEFFSPDWFMDKIILDIGCNTGRFAISLARRFQLRRVVGIDLDQHLIGAARKNLRHFIDKDAKIVGKFPASFETNFGPVSAPSISSGPRFPENVWFFCENYIQISDDDLANVKEEYDIIFALSITKWIHLNWGDTGIRRLFLRAFRHLRTGGRFVLETTPFKDYKKHCSKKGRDKPPDDVLRILNEINFYPDQFSDYLISVVGFSHHENLDIPYPKTLGVSGRLQVFYKGRFMLDSEEGRTFAWADNAESTPDPHCYCPTPTTPKSDGSAF